MRALRVALNDTVTNFCRAPRAAGDTTPLPWKYRWPVGAAAGTSRKPVGVKKRRFSPILSRLEGMRPSREKPTESADRVSSRPELPSGMGPALRPKNWRWRSRVQGLRATPTPRPSTPLTLSSLEAGAPSLPVEGGMPAGKPMMR